MADIYDWSTTAADNDDADATINWLEGQLPGTVNGSARAMMKRIKELLNDVTASGTVGGTADAITLTSAIGALATGKMVRFVAASSNTGAATLAVNGLTAKAIRKISGGTDVALSAGDIAAGETYLVMYRATANGAAGGWVIVGSSAATTFATNAQAVTGTSTVLALNPANLAAALFKGSDEASAGTVSFGDGGFFHVTGTTTITDIDFDVATNGRTVDVVFDGALTLTHNGTTLQLPGAGNITTAAGDRARFVQDSADNVICLFYQRASGAPITGGITLGTAVASTSGTSIDFTGIPSTAKRVTVMFDSVSTNGTDNILVQIGSGSVDATNYRGIGIQINGGAVTTSNSTTGFLIQSGAAGNIVQGALHLNLLGSNIWTCDGNIGFSNSTVAGITAGSHATSGALDRVRITTTGGANTFDLGTVNISYE